MLNLFFRPVASPVRARFMRWAPPLVCAWMLATPMAHAAESMAMPMEMSPTPPLGSYQNWRDEPVQDWTASNDRVREIGGWLTYLREAQQTGDSAGPNSQGHHDHHGH